MTVTVTGSTRIFLVLFFGAYCWLGHSQTLNLETWHFKREFLPALQDAIPKILRGQDKSTGKFGSGLWLPGDQNVIYPLAVAWAINEPANRFYHDPRLLEAIMAGGDALIGAQDK